MIIVIVVVLVDLEAVVQAPASINPELCCNYKGVINQLVYYIYAMAMSAMGRTPTASW